VYITQYATHKTVPNLIANRGRMFLSPARKIVIQLFYVTLPLVFTALIFASTSTRGSYSFDIFFVVFFVVFFALLFVYPLFLVNLISWILVPFLVLYYVIVYGPLFLHWRRKDENAINNENVKLVKAGFPKQLFAEFLIEVREEKNC
jgi:hypothetical protein